MGCYPLEVMITRRALLLLGVWAVSGCLTRSLPVPPPSATVQALTACAPEDCPNGGVTVTVAGLAQPGAMVLVEDTNPATVGPRGEALVAGARALEDGAFRVVLTPVRDGTTVRAPQRGDTLNVYQITASGEASQSLFLQVPR